MICLDTSFLVDLWRCRNEENHPAVMILRQNAGETFVVPAHAAGEFLEGAACISETRVRESLAFLRLFEVGPITLETAEHYGKIVADLRRRSLLAGVSKIDMWIAAWAVEHGAVLATRDKKHFEPVADLHLLPYELA